MIPLNIFNLCIAILGGTSGERFHAESNAKELSFLDKFQQHDYNISFERVEKLRYDKRYIRFLNIWTFKYNRTWAVVNASHMYNVDIGYDLEIVTQMYKFASNEYRQFPGRFQMNFCNATEKNVMGLGDFRNCGTFIGCPLERGKNYSICNWAPNPTAFPPFLPSGEYMFEMQALFGSVELFAIRAFGKAFRPIV